MSNHEDRSGRPEDEAVGLDDTGSGRAALGREQVLSIENVARMFGVSRWTLRAYEWRGLIARRLTHGRVRVYGWADCERLSVIIKCRKAGVALRDVIAIVAATDEDALDPMCRAAARSNAWCRSTAWMRAARCWRRRWPS